MSIADGVDEPAAEAGAALLAAPDGARRPRRTVTLWIGVVVVAAWVLVAFTVPLWAPYDPLAQDLHHRLQGPSAAHWFGTDKLGRDLFSRVMYGARISLPIAFVAVTVALVIGCLIGSVAASSKRGLRRFPRVGLWTSSRN